jgi:hypothetical protein
MSTIINRIQLLQDNAAHTGRRTAHKGARRRTRRVTTTGTANDQTAVSTYRAHRVGTNLHYALDARAVVGGKVHLPSKVKGYWRALSATWPTPKLRKLAPKSSKNLGSGSEIKPISAHKKSISHACGNWMQPRRSGGAIRTAGRSPLALQKVPARRPNGAARVYFKKAI